MEFPPAAVEFDVASGEVAEVSPCLVGFMGSVGKSRMKWSGARGGVNAVSVGEEAHVWGKRDALAVLALVAPGRLLHLAWPSVKTSVTFR